MNRPEEIIRELVDLYGKRPLRGDDLERAKELMKKLRQMGFTIKDIFAMVGRTWSIPTIKLYTRGVTITDETFRKETVKLLSEMATLELTLDDVAMAISLESSLNEQNTTLREVGLLVNSLEESGTSPSDLTVMHKELKNIGLSYRQLREALDFEVELDKMKITIRLLQAIIEAARKFGSAEKIIEAINLHIGLEDIKTCISKETTLLSDIQTSYKKLESQSMELQTKTQSLKNEIAAYEQAKSLGFEYKELVKIQELSSKMGGLEKVLEALAMYASVYKVQKDLEDDERKKRDLEAETKKVQADHAHLKSVIGICDKLLYDLNFSVPSIQDVYETAEKYGDPIEVLTALAKYGSIRTMEEKVSQLEMKLFDMEQDIDSKNKILSKQEARMEELDVYLANLFDALSRGLAESYQKATGEIARTYKSKIEEIRRDEERYLELERNAIKLSEELKLARTVYAAYKYPMEVPAISLQQIIIFVETALRVIEAKNINPTKGPSEELKRLYVVLQAVPAIGVTELLTWTIENLEVAVAQGVK